MFWVGRGLSQAGGDWLHLSCTTSSVSHLNRLRQSLTHLPAQYLSHKSPFPSRLLPAVQPVVRDGGRLCQRLDATHQGCQAGRCADLGMGSPGGWCWTTAAAAAAAGWVVGGVLLFWPGSQRAQLSPYSQTRISIPSRHPRPSNTTTPLLPSPPVQA